MKRANSLYREDAAARSVGGRADAAGAVESLRLRQYAFRQDAIQVFINGQPVAKISESGGGNQITVPLNDHAVKLLKKGRNTLAATDKHTWRWGRYFRGKDGVYGRGISLSLEMQARNRAKE